MSEKSPLYGSDTAALAAFPEPVQAALHLLQRVPLNDAALILLQCVASSAHPDYLFNLSMLCELPIEYKAAAFELIEHSLTCGLTLDEKADLLRFVEPLLTGSFRI